MSTIAKHNGVDVYANVVAWDKSLRERSFECQCDECNAELILKTGEKIKPYFTAIPSAPHMPGCFYGSNLLIDPDECIEPANMHNTLHILLEGKSISRRGVGDGTGAASNSTRKKRLNTLPSMYCYLKSNPLSRNVAGMLVKEILIDDRSAKYYLGRDTHGVHIVEGYLQGGNFYDSQEMSIGLQVNAYCENEKLNIKIRFENFKLFKEAKAVFFDAKSGKTKREKRVVVLGDWVTKDGYLTTEIKLKKNFITFDM